MKKALNIINTIKFMERDLYYCNQGDTYNYKEKEHRNLTLTLQSSIQQSNPSLQSKIVSLPKDDRDHLEIPPA